jgi:hypothetical protein
MASGLQTTGPIKMSQIREEFLDDRNNNRLNEYGDGDSGLVPNNRYTGTQRKFSDYYGRKFTIIKELTDPNTQIPTNNSPRLEYDVHLLFTTTERQAPNDKVINIRDPGVPIGTIAGSAFGQKDWGVFQLSFYQITQTNNNQSANVIARNGRINITVNNYAKVYAPGGQQFRYQNVYDRITKDGGNAFKIYGLDSTNQLNLQINNFGEVRAGGGSGAPGGLGGEGLTENGVITFGGNGGTGGPGRGYQIDSPYYIQNISGSPGQNPLGPYAGAGGTGGDGGDWAQPGKAGAKGADGSLPSPPLPTQNISISIGAGGNGGYGNTNGLGGGNSSISYDGYTITAAGGSGGIYNSLTNPALPALASGSGSSDYQIEFFEESGGVGGSAVGDVGGGGGGAVGLSLTDNTSSNGQRGAFSALDSLDIRFEDIMKFESYWKQALGVTTVNDLRFPSGNAFGGRGGSSGSQGLNNAGQDAQQWGSGGGGAGYYGGDGGNGIMGGGGGGAAGYDRNNTPCAFFMSVASTERWVRTKTSRNLSTAESVTFAIVAPGSWGETPDSPEGIELEYSLNGTVWVSIDYTDGGATRPTNWLIKTVALPAEAKTATTWLRYRQREWSGAFDVWGVGPMYVKSGGLATQVIDFSDSNTYAYAGTLQFTTPNNYVPQPPYIGTPPQLFWTGGKGGHGGAMVVCFSQGTVIDIRTFGEMAILGFKNPSVYSFQPPTGTTEIWAWVIGAGGGGAGSGSVDASAGGGGNGGQMAFAKWSGSAGLTGTPNTDGSASTETPGAAGKAVYFPTSTRPVSYTFSNNGTLNGSTS